MANILDRYGIKEVADVTFYQIGQDGHPSYPVLYLDTLKVSTIEQTAETSEARGGKGNAALIAWDYGKEITVTLEDALFSAKSMAIMFGNGSVASFDSGKGAVKEYIAEDFQYGTDELPDGAFDARYFAKDAGVSDGVLVSEPQDGETYNVHYKLMSKESGSVYDKNSQLIMKTIQFTYDGTAPNTWTGPKGERIAMINPKYYDEVGNYVDVLEKDHKYFCSFDVAVAGSVIEVSANTFPGTYYVTGDTYARSETTGNDEFFQFIIPKAKVQSENTITLEAEGDPSVFNMSLRVLRPADGVMMKLVKYELAGNDVSSSDSAAAVIAHNHYLKQA